MNKTFKTKIQFNSSGRTCEPESNSIYQNDISALNLAKNLMSEHIINDSSNIEKITIDWSEFLENTKLSYYLNTLPKNEKKKWLDENNLLFATLPFIVEFNEPIEMCNSNGDINVNSFKNHLTKIIYESFLLVNLSSPGSFVFYNGYIENTHSSIDIEGELFEYCHFFCFHNNWPKIQYIDLNIILNWYKTIDIEEKDTSSIKMGRALYAILHACKSGYSTPITLIWLAYALEAIYVLPVGQAFTVLYNRICDFLEISQSDKPKFKKLLRSFYDERNRFAHGGSPVLHPRGWHFEDHDSQKYIDLLTKINDFAFSIILATIQKMISNSWKEMSFNETISGVHI